MLKDSDLTQKILENYDKNLEELIRIKHGDSKDSALMRKNIAIDMSWPERNEEKKAIIMNLTGGKVPDSFLELGCGLGSAIHSMSRISISVVGVDLSLSQLLLAGKIVEEQKSDNVRLICASVFNLPFADNLFDVVFANDVIEHVDDQLEFIRTGWLKVKPGGYFIFNSPNRLSLFSPEPHTNVWFAGFLPRPWIKHYIYLVKKMDYSDKRLLSYFELRRKLKKLGMDWSIKGLLKEELDGVSKNQRKTKLLKRIPFGLTLLNKAFKYFVPSYFIVIKKGD
jgi:2-polyprenyl-3-methyl-5-hydroxy-6-metoxy-1,4-benzoquinol methylase